MIMLCFLALLPAAAPREATMTTLVLDFRAPVEWMTIDDVVMGGRSSSKLVRSDGGAAFLGDLSLENNGGFASVRIRNPHPDLSGFETLVLRVRGDGRRYQLRLRDDRRFDGVAWASQFETSDGTWREVRLPLDGFRPTFRGRQVRGAGELRSDRVYQITLMLADKTSGPFRLELEDLRGERAD